MQHLAAADPLRVDDIREHYDRLSPLYRKFWGEHIHHGYWQENETPRKAQANLTRELARRAAIRRSESVLDVGCGLGGSSLVLAHDFGCRVKGISLSPRQVEAARREARHRKLEERVTFAVQDANHLAGEPETYDVIWIIECSEHVFDKPRFVAACADRLNPGGRLAVCAWLTEENLSQRQQQLVEIVLRGMLCPSFGTLRDYIGWMEQNGLQLLSAENITTRVARTWELCKPVLKSPVVKTMLAAGPARWREFADSFDAIDQAYRTGAMVYGMFVAQKQSFATLPPRPEA